MISPKISPKFQFPVWFKCSSKNSLNFLQNSSFYHHFHVNLTIFFIPVFQRNFKNLPNFSIFLVNFDFQYVSSPCSRIRIYPLLKTINNRDFCLSHGKTSLKNVTPNHVCLDIFICELQISSHPFSDSTLCSKL